MSEILIGKALAGMKQEEVEAVKRESLRLGLDFYKLIAAKALGKDHWKVAIQERSEAKRAVFAWAFGVSGVKLTNMTRKMR